MFSLFSPFSRFARLLAPSIAPCLSPCLSPFLRPFHTSILASSIVLLGFLAGCGPSTPAYDPYAPTTLTRAPATRNWLDNPYNPAQNNAGLSSRLDQQPWPPGMGQRYGATPNQALSAQTATAASRSIYHSNPGIAATQNPGNALATASASGSTSPAAPQLKSFAPAPAGKIKVALLLPLSGKDAPLGEAMLNAAQMAVFDLASPNFELMPQDTNGTPSGAINAAKSALDNNAQLFIGPVFAKDVAAVKPLARKAHINMLALTTDVSLGASGSWVMGFAPAPQINRIIQFARHRGFSHFGLLVPATAYGKLVRQSFEMAVRSTGGTPQIYTDENQLIAALNSPAPPDILMLPYGGIELQTLTTRLQAASPTLSRTKLIGTGLWDDPELAQKNPLLKGGWFATSAPELREKFVQNYTRTYGAEPPRLATLAYDATALPAVLTAKGYAIDETSLANPVGFAGLDGLFRLNPEGTAERGLAVAEVTSSGNRIIDPAPTSFYPRR